MMNIRMKQQIIVITKKGKDQSVGEVKEDIIVAEAEIKEVNMKIVVGGEAMIKEKEAEVVEI